MLEFADEILSAKERKQSSMTMILHFQIQQEISRKRKKKIQQEISTISYTLVFSYARDMTDHWRSRVFHL